MFQTHDKGEKRSVIWKRERRQTPTAPTNILCVEI